MKLDNEFTVGVPIEQAWAVLTDLELIAPCMPGAQLTGVTDGVYTGKVKIKVGPVTAEYAGTAQFSVKEETGYRAVIDARGRDSRGNGNATAIISAHLQPVGQATVVSVSTDLTIAGRIAQFGSGMIKEISAKLLGQFTDCLESKLSAGLAGTMSTAETADAGGAPEGSTLAAGPVSTASTASTTTAPTEADSASPVGGTSPASAPIAVGAAPTAGPAGTVGTGGTSAVSTSSSSGPEPVALDLMSVAGRAILKRLAPLIVGLVVLAVIIYLIVR